MKKQKRIPMAIRNMDTNPICDICGKHRGTKKHALCSKKRQAINAAKYE